MTPHQSKVLKSIASYWDDNGYSPRYTDLKNMLGYKSEMVVGFHVHGLVDRGYILHQPRKKRSLELTEKGEAYIKKTS